jgi:type II secretory pathway predicted ATPase ExeA
MGQAGTYSADSGKGRVYLGFYRLEEAPFSLTPDPDFLFSSQTHQQVIDKILYGIQSRMGFILLTGEVGTGKTTICRIILDSLESVAETVYIINPSLSGTELISSILDDLNVPHLRNATKKELIDSLNQFLLAAERHRPVVIIIDDAQTMHVEALEDLRLLSNLETDKNKLLQIVLVGQPELAEMISRPNMRQLQQRVAVNCFLNYLVREEVESYISRRLFVAGDKGRISFTSDATKLIFKASGGIPRLINKICDYALTAGYVVDAYTISAEHVKLALEELGDLRGCGNASSTGALSLIKRKAWRWLLMTALCVSAVLCAGVFYYVRETTPPETHVLTTDVQTAPSVVLPGPSEVPGNDKKEMPPTAPPGRFSPKPYALQLGSYVTLAQVSRAVSFYGGKGIDANWQMTDLGPDRPGYKLYAGLFETKEAALAYRDAKGIDGAVVLLAPWTVQVGSSGSDNDLERLRGQLRDQRLDTQMIRSPDGTSRLFSGAFASEQRALKIVGELQRFGIAAKAVQR